MASNAAERDLAKLNSLVATNQFETLLAKEGLSDLLLKMQREVGNSKVAAPSTDAQAIKAETSINIRTDASLSWVFQKWAESNITPTNSLETLTLGVHCLMLENNFTNLVKIASTVPGFAPSIREVSPSKFIPDQWKVDVGAEGILYKHALGKAPFALTIKCAQGNTAAVAAPDGDDDTAAELVFSHKNEDVFKTMLKVSTLVHSSCSVLGGGQQAASPEALFVHGVGALREATVAPLVAALQRKLAPQDSSAAPAPAAAAAAAAHYQQQQQQQQQPVFPPRDHEPSPAGAARAATVPGPAPPSLRVGEGDLHPAGTIVPPDLDLRPRTNHHIPPPHGGSGGSLVGPDHPLFGGGPSGLRDRDPGYPAFPGAPQPRFDPYGPVPGANGPDLGGYPGPGYPQNNPSWEPEPDHLRPPGVPDVLLQQQKPKQPRPNANGDNGLDLRFKDPTLPRGPMDPRRRPGGGGGGGLGL